MNNEYELDILKTLPRPPKNFHSLSDEAVRAWLKSVADVSAEGLRTAFQPHNWPGSLQQRLNVWGRYAELEREAQQRDEARVRAADEARMEKLRAAEQRARSKAGWGYHG
jgi:hypothetical protein